MCSPAASASTASRRRRSRKWAARSASPGNASASWSHAPYASFGTSHPLSSCTCEPNSYVAAMEPRFVDVPFVGSADLFLDVGEWIVGAGLTPIVAHPERTDAVLTNPGLADEIAERGWLLQVNASSLLGRHTPEMEEQGWRLVDDGLAS